MQRSHKLYFHEIYFFREIRENIVRARGPKQARNLVGYARNLSEIWKSEIFSS